ncbi:MAG TPA: hypothetical protein VHK27_02360 [Gammaproteobacteria bacterium]|nr:hypothetical protein [Gammaproteobacteria bacterium]
MARRAFRQDIGAARLSIAGWTHYEELERGTADSRTAFMAMKFGDQELDHIFQTVLVPAVKQTGFDLHRLDSSPRAGLIDDRLRAEILRSRFLMADLRHENLGTYWEADYAEGRDKPVIYTCRRNVFEKASTHFDTNHHLTVMWDPADKEKKSGRP